MARRFHRHRAAHPIADLNVTNLIDLGFILLVIFMIATPLMQNEQTLPINLPKVTEMPQSKDSKDEKFIVVGVDSAGRFYVESPTAPVALAELQSRLRAYAQDPKQPVMRIRGLFGFTVSDPELPAPKPQERVRAIQPWFAGTEE